MTTEPRLLGGRYEIGEVIGYGGMAEVHRGRDLRLGRDVAVKLLRADLSRDESFLIRFRREAQNSASLNHPNIVAVFDTGEENGIPYMVMEFVNGRTLKEVLLAEGRFEYSGACEIVADMCSALDFSHKHHIIHRDVKPGNVMLSETQQVKVMDFGIARALASGQATMTQTSAVIGTAQYLSPEQARGETVDGRSDVYAVGCVLYELLVGHPPFTGDNPVSVAYQHVREEARPPSELNPAVPPSVDAVVMKALAKNPDNRYQSAGEMREDLIRAARGEAVMAPAVMGADDRTQMIGGADSTAPITPIQTRAGKRRPWLIALGIILALAVVGAGAWAIMKALETDPMVTVPTVIGETEEDAIQILEDANLVAVPVDQTADSSDDGDIDNVIDQTPAADDEVEQGTEVEITVLRAPEQIEMPNAVGEQYDEVEPELTEQGFKVERESQDSALPEGEVIGQSLDAGDMFDPGTELTLTVSGGGVGRVPNVTGMTEERAIEALSAEGFNADVSYVADGSTLGTVFSQDPSEGAELDEGETVEIQVTGVVVTWDATTVPTDLQATLQSEGLNVTLDPEDGEAIESVTGPDGDLTSGQAVKPGSDVTIRTTEDNGGGGGGNDPPTDGATATCQPLDPTCDEDAE
ncbi:Stk1 family PASTA domain-containing Ser/Thr kinase [Glycomyces buryatensis]|uniref:non-specific serine/threonine protein kinase n=1 Tax=Glycomyces buryatensis TaxID=2570927 RepID=A0A4S8Q1E8_9ACTN|nr:Stk1 family PASTA domain-containing Ser/Thr kinase [Glycomyces buryatensis]THV33924.1 Stk1 family PASTA domain-containing Ser/Thr kinase [Glycomyces buryatensis]